MREQQVVLKQQPNAPAFGGERSDVVIAEKHAAARGKGRIEMAGDEGEQGGLSGAARPHDGLDRAGLDAEGQAFDQASPFDG